MRSKFALLIALASVLTCFCGCNTEPKSTTVFAMDTVMELEVYSDCPDGFLSRCEALIYELEGELSFKDGGQIQLLNSSKSGTVTALVEALIERSCEISRMTGGCFDITVEPLMSAWGFKTDIESVPDSKTISEALRYVDYKKIKLNDGKIELNGTSIDLGGVAKGYASSRLYELCSEFGVKSALFNLGGNVRTVGIKPNGEKWNVGVKDPNDPKSILCAVKVSDKAVITSGGYERRFVENGVSYHHILDPKSGYPAESGLLSVTVISDDDVLADALSTGIFVGGLPLASDLYTETKAAFEYILVTDNNEIICSEGIKASVVLIDENYIMK